MADYICIDGGTTNTRVRLVRDCRIVDGIHLDIGVVRAHDCPQEFRSCLKNAIDTLLRQNHMEPDQITRILASGMITSDLGLYTLPHAGLPAGLSELHNSACEVLLPDISAIPFVFIRGLKTNGNFLGDIDIMRGEETELAGIMDDASNECCTYILPGSHSKVVYTDDRGRITDFFTAMTGEMLAALSGYTILKNSVQLENASLDQQQLLAGYEYCAAEGLNKALFKVRISDTMLKMNPSARYSFFLGAVLCGEITAILKRAAGKIVVGGRQQLRDALCALLKHASDLEIVCLPQEKIDSCVALGAVKIYEYNNKQ